MIKNQKEAKNLSSELIDKMSESSQGTDKEGRAHQGKTAADAGGRQAAGAVRKHRPSQNHKVAIYHEEHVIKVLMLILIAAGSFLAGSWVTYQGGRSKATAERKILHYVDPMNPAFKSDKPGIAPCGMPLEPVYADQGDSAAGGADLRASMPPGTIRISPEKQQLIGVKTATVEKAPWSHTLRVLGRVTPDETRIYRINAAVNGWIEDVLPVTTGSLVKER